MEPITVTFITERETKRTIRFAEVVADGAEPVIGTLYVQKTTLKKLGDPESLTVTLSA